MQNEEILWSIAEGEKENGKPYVLRFLEFYPTKTEQERLSYLIEISWDYLEENPIGMPDQETYELMNYFEDTLDEEIISEESSILVLTMLGDEKKLWLIYANNPDSFMDKLNEVMEGRKVLPIQFEVFQDSDWNGYKEFIGLVK